MTNKITEMCIDRTRPFSVNSLLTENPFGILTFNKDEDLCRMVRKFDPEIDTIFEMYQQKKAMTFLQKRILIEERGDIPLGVYSLRAILEKPRMVKFIKKTVRSKVDYIHNPESTVFVDFSGTILYDKDNNKYVVGIEFNLAKDEHKVVPYSINDEVGQFDFSLIFGEHVTKRISQFA